MERSEDKTIAGRGRRDVLIGGAAVAAGALAASASAQVPPDPRTAGPIAAGRDSKLAGKTAFVSGAARGIGRAIAVELAANGADVMIFDIAGYVSPASNAAPATAADLAETKRQIEAHGRRCLAVKGDVRDIAALRRAATQMEQSFGKIDVVVADAAIQRWKDLLEMEDSDWTDVIDVNLNGTANQIRAFAPHMVARKAGAIIVLSSMQGKHGTGGAASYSASKHGIIGLMKSAAIELGKHGVTCNALLPGLVDTALTRYPERWSHVIGETTDTPPKNPSEAETWNNRAPRVPLRVGWMRAEDISPMAVFLASDGGRMATGACFEVTAGDSALDV